jgi:hypothetical protein
VGGLSPLLFGEASAEVEQFLDDLNCPASTRCDYADRDGLLLHIDHYVSTHRNDPDLQQRRSNFVRGYVAAPLARQQQSSVDVMSTQRHGTSLDISGLHVNVGTLKRALATEAAHVARQVHALVASIVWPHISFSLLPLLLPNIRWPAFISRVAAWARSLAFLDAGQLTRPECFAAKSSSAAQKKLTRFCTSHGAFWILLLLYVTYAAAKGRGTKTNRSTVWSRAVNASVWAFALLHAMLLRSCLNTLHCIDEGLTDSHLGHLAAETAVNCDQRGSWLMFTVLVSITLAVLAWSCIVRWQPDDWTNVKTWVRSTSENVWKDCSVFSSRNFSSGTTAAQRASVYCGILACSGFFGALCLLVAMLISPEPSLGRSEYALTLLGAVGILVYGIIIPWVLYRQLSSAAEAQILHSPKVRNRYGYLTTRFKKCSRDPANPAWVAEFRILGRKSALLVVSTIFAEYPYAVIPAQLLILGYALWKQYTETPFAEIGHARKAWAEQHPNGLGWSRGDRLEALSLAAQICNVLGSIACVTGLTLTPRVVDISVSAVTVVCMLLPACYGIKIIIDEWKAEPTRRRRWWCCCCGRFLSPRRRIGTLDVPMMQDPLNIHVGDAPEPEPALCAEPRRTAAHGDYTRSRR